MQLRAATVEDTPGILEVYNHQVLTSTATFDLVPRTLEEQRSWLTDRSGAHVVLVAVDDDGTVAGFAALSPYRDRAAYSTTVEDSVYVAEPPGPRGGSPAAGRPRASGPGPTGSTP